MYYIINIKFFLKNFIVSYNFFWVILVLTSFFCLSLKIASPSVLALRPLHFIGVLILIFFCLWYVLYTYHYFKFTSILSLKFDISLALIFFYLALYLFEFPRGDEDSYRSVKDFIYGTTIDIGIFILISSYAVFSRHSISQLIRVLSWVLFIWGFFSGLVGWLFFKDFIFIISNNVFTNNPVWGVRFHGLQGEPTHFGATLAIGLLSLSFIYTQSANRIFKFFYLSFSSLMFSALILSGSKNSILSIFIAICVMLFFSKKRLNFFVIFITSFFIGFSLISFKPYLTKVIPNNYQESHKTTEVTPNNYQESHKTTEVTPNNYQESHVTIKTFFNMIAKSMSYDLTTIKGALRITDEGSVGARMSKFISLGSSFLELPVRHQLLGLGYGALDRNELRTSFNSYLDILLRFGIIHLILVIYFLLILVKVLIWGINNLPEYREVYTYALSMCVFSLTFSLFISTWHSMFFHIANIGFTIALVTIFFSLQNLDNRT
jgi:hypothetical protein